MKKVVQFTREQVLVDSKPEDKWEVQNCTPVEACDMAFRLLGAVLQNLRTINESQINEQQKLIQSLVQNVPGAKEYADVWAQGTSLAGGSPVLKH